ncbi:MAG: metallophosphoesterase [Dysgonomonas sp.]
MIFVDNDLPESFIGKKIIFVSDIHVNEYFTGEDVSDLVKRINERNPDIIILGGDYTKKEEKYSQSFFKEISKLESTFGVYTVLGNHDHWEDTNLIQEGLLHCGFNICDNKSYWIKNGKDSIKIGGVGDYWEDKQLLENTISDVKETDFCLLISHNPDYMENIHSNLVNLVLSGHTHAGQVTLFGFWAPIMPSTGHPEYPQTGLKYRYGWKEKGNTKLYVTSGVGMGGFPLRFFARPEIVEIVLSK